MFQTKKAKIIVVSLLFMLLLGVGLLFIDKVIQQNRNFYLNAQSKLLQNKYALLHKYLKIMSHDIYSMYENKPKLIALLASAPTQSIEQRAQTRRAVYELLIKNYKRLENMGIAQVHFHLPDNRSFLRMYAPDKFGDDLSQTRPSVVLANKRLKPTEGLEACPYLLGYRFVYPLFSKDKKHIGSVEISYSTQMIFNNLIEDFTYDYHLLISKKLAANSIISREYGYNYKPTWESSSYYVEESTHKRLKDTQFYTKLKNKELIKKLNKQIQTGKPFATTVEYNYQQIVLNFLPLPAVDGTPNIAYIVTYKTSNYLARAAIQANYIKLLFIAITFLLYLFVLYIILNRERLKELALYDALTNLPNRMLFSIELQNELARAKRYNYKLALLFIDLDGFKAVNDTYGHHIGDELLKEVAKKLRSSIRKVDLTARLSGDEFTVVLSHIKHTKEVLAVSQHILETLNEEIIINGHSIKIGASIGVSIYPDDAADMQQLLLKADKNMYHSKESGKNKITYQQESL